MVVAAIDWGELLKVIYTALIAGLAVPTLFALVLYGSTRSQECRRAGNGSGATVFGGVAALFGILFVAAIVFALTIILQK
jgi:hypothetical protein